VEPVSTPSPRPTPAIGRWLSLAAALGAGTYVGYLDHGATEVQGPLLMFLVAAFAIAAFRRAPAWAVGLLVAIGLPLGHLYFGDASPSMLFVAIPVLVAAYAGAGVGMLVGATGATLVVEPVNRAGAPLGRPSPAVMLGGGLAACAVAGWLPVHATLLARAQPNAWWVATIWQVVTLLAWVFAAPVAVRARREAEGDLSFGDVATHAAIVVVAAGVHAAALPLLSLALFIPLGDSGAAGAAAWAFAVYLPLDALAYLVVLALAAGADASRRAARLQAGITAAELAALKARLQPHFLFNALNGVIVLARRGEAAAAADALEALADLLRYVLREGPDLVPLEEELAFAERYLAVERMRYADRLRAQIVVDDAARGMLVPALLLQPLVENAVRHGVAAKLDAGNVTIRARAAGGVLEVEIADDGPGPRPGAIAEGVGLRATRSRLATLYGAAATVTLEPGSTGGAVARVRMPARRSASA